MYALTIKQPWAWAIAYGGKRIENRTWQPPQAAMGQLLAIHAGKSFDRTEEGAFTDILAGMNVSLYETYQRQRETLPYGAVLAVARFSGVVTHSPSLWFSGPFGWELDEIVSITPVPCLGKLGLWHLPEDVEQQVLECLKRTIIS